MLRSRNISAAESFSLDWSATSMIREWLGDLLKRRNKEVEVVDLWDLLDKFGQAFHELLGIQVVQHIQVQPVFSTMNKCGSVSSPDLRQLNHKERGGFSLRKDITPNDGEDQWSWIDSLEVTPRHLKYQAHTTWASSHCQCPSLDPSCLPFLLR